MYINASISTWPFADPGTPINDDLMLNPNVDKLYRKLPDTLSEALRCLAASQFAASCLGEDMAAGFVKVKRKEFDLYTAKITDWEREFYIDCWCGGCWRRGCSWCSCFALITTDTLYAFVNDDRKDVINY